MDDERIKELEEKLRSRRAERNYNFFKPVGQIIEHVDTINFRMDGDGTFHFGNVEQVNKDKDTTLSDEKLAQAIVNCQKYFWGQSSYAVLFCLLRDDCKKDMQQTAFERMIEILPYKGERDFLCPSGTIANAFSDNNIYKTHVSRWQVQGATERVMTLLNMLRKELGIINSSI